MNATTTLHQQIAELNQASANTALVLHLTRVLYGITALGGVALFLSCLRG